MPIPFVTLLVIMVVLLIWLLALFTPVTTSAIVRDRIQKMQSTIAKVQVALNSEAEAIDHAMRE